MEFFFSCVLSHGEGEKHFACCPAGGFSPAVFRRCLHSKFNVPEKAGEGFAMAWRRGAHVPDREEGSVSRRIAG